MAEQKIFVIDVVRGRGKTGEAKTGKERLLTRDTDALYTLRTAAAEALQAVPVSDWPAGKTKEEIIMDVVNKVLEGPVGPDVHDITLPGNIMVRLRTERAAHYGVTGDYPESPKEPWQMTKAEWAAEIDQRDFVTGETLEDITKRLERWERTHGMVTSPDSDVSLLQRHMQAHHDVVRKAFADGKPVPESVLQEYPELSSDIADVPAKVSSYPAPGM
jgi:hypothetical protein